ncbi:MAG: AAA family ATPase, partial [Gammaproteobacteria bacterium]
MHLPIGVANFRDLIENKDPNQEGYLYVDKTLLIKEIIYALTPAIVLTRPRRFGKTLNLSMLHHFWASEVNGRPTKGLFENLSIAKELKCMEQQGQYPVIFITLKDAKYKTYELCYEYIKKQIAKAYSEYRFLLSKEQLNPEEKFLFKQILEGNAKQVDWHESLKSLTNFVEKGT